MLNERPVFNSWLELNSFIINVHAGGELSVIVLLLTRDQCMTILINTLVFKHMYLLGY